ncbi:MAG TPA: hypothetical protein PK595_06435 [Bacteroidota bacterium]|nr:hypothetical protein [Bacteroidota bacterium]
MNLILRNIQQLITPLTRPMEGCNGNFQTLSNAAVVMQNGKFIWIGQEEQFDSSSFELIDSFDASDYIALPGFVDPLTFPFFPHINRKHDALFEPWREQWAPSLIKEKVFHFLRTLNQASKVEIKKASRFHFEQFLKHGITTARVSIEETGDEATTFLLLQLAKELHNEHLLDSILACYIGLGSLQHTSLDNYTQWLSERFLPYLSDHRSTSHLVLELGLFQDIQLEKILTSSNRYGFDHTVLVDFFNRTNGIWSSTTDNSQCVITSPPSNDDITLLQQTKTLAILSPMFFLFTRQKPFSIRTVLDAGIPVALSSGFHPVIGRTLSPQLTLMLACSQFEFTPEEALTALTLTGALACGCHNVVGSIEIGMQSDLLLARANDFYDLVYYNGTNFITKIIKNGVMLDF